MIQSLLKYYREYIPHRIRHGIRQIPNRLKYLFRDDLYIEDDSVVFKEKADELYRENVQWFYTIPNAFQDGILNFDKSELIYKNGINRIFRFNRVSCYGASDLIRFDENHYFYEVRNYYLREQKMGIAYNDGVGVLVDERDFYILGKYGKRNHIEKGVLLSTYFSNNYYHYTFQCVAKLRICDAISKEIPLLVHESIAKYPSFLELLQICNVDNREVILLSSDIQYDVDELYYVSPQMISVPNYKVGAIMKPDDDLYSIESLAYLRKMMLPHMDTEWEVPEKVFLQRRFASSRRGYNEEECEHLLAKYGFVGVRPETLTFSQQMSLFNKAKCIVGATGAAFTNLVYANSRCRYVVLKGAYSENSMFASLAAFNGAKLVYLCDNTQRKLMDASLEHGSFHIDTDELKILIDQVLFTDDSCS